MRAQGRTYTDEFRAEAVALYRRTDRSVAKVADDLGVNHHTLRYWLKLDAMKQKKRAPRPTTPPANETAEQKVARLERELEKLKRENARLQEDREILKKAAAFFAKESE
jgi:transposase